MLTIFSSKTRHFRSLSPWTRPQHIETIWCIVNLKLLVFVLKPPNLCNYVLVFSKLNYYIASFMKAKFNLSVIIILRRIINYHCFVDVLLKYSLWVWPASMWFLNSLVPYVMKQKLFFLRISAQIFVHRFTRLTKELFFVGPLVSVLQKYWVPALLGVTKNYDSKPMCKLLVMYLKCMFLMLALHDLYCNLSVQSFICLSFVLLMQYFALLTLW